MINFVGIAPNPSLQEANVIFVQRKLFFVDHVKYPLLSPQFPRNTLELNLTQHVLIACLGLMVDSLVRKFQNLRSRFQVSMVQVLTLLR